LVAHEYLFQGYLVTVTEEITRVGLGLGVENNKLPGIAYYFSVDTLDVPKKIFGCMEIT
jgi:hypothetical protein